MAEQERDRVAVVGLGYVGLALSCIAARRYAVSGIDIDRERVDAVNRGVLPLRGIEPGMADALSGSVRAGYLRAHAEFGPCRGARYILVCVDTPLTDGKRMDMERFMGAIRPVGENLSQGSTVIIESTVAPGTTTGHVVPELERRSGLRAGNGFHVAHCPERVMPGRLFANIERCDRVIGGTDEEGGRRALEFYRSLLDVKFHVTDALTAEVVKTAENAYRDVQIAFANEVALLCEAYGSDVFEVRKLVNTSPFRDMHLPGGGVGGPCLPKDPWLLVSGAEGAARLIPTARRVNDAMPAHVADLLESAFRSAGRGEGEGLVTILGTSYRAGSGEMRNSPSLVLRDILLERGYTVRLHDPHADHPDVRNDLSASLEGADCAVIMVAHQEYIDIEPEDIVRMMRGDTIVDARNVLAGKVMRTVNYVSLGRPLRRRG